MWNAYRISPNLYTLRSEHAQEDSAATVSVLSGSQRLMVQASLCLTYVQNEGDYQLLLEAVRKLADDHARAAGTAQCLIQYECSGLLEKEGGLSLLPTGSIGCYSYAEAAFIEER